jgi:hypothetical protein
MGIKVYVIVLWHNGIPHFLQLNNKVAWYFEHGVKAYVRLGNAINAAKKLTAKYHYDKISIYHIPYSMSFRSCDFVEGEFDKYLVHQIRKD